MKKNQKKPYKKPTIKSEKVIETAALACGKCTGGGPIFQGACNKKNKVS